MTVSTRELTQERRARLLAERKLETRQAEMRKDVAEKQRLTASLTEAILLKREQLDRLQADLEQAQTETRAVHDRLAGAEDARNRSESRLWHALETVRDGFAMYDDDARLTCANRAFLSLFDDLEEVRPGVTYGRLCELMLEEGIVDPGMPGSEWLALMAARWTADHIPDQTISLWDGQFVKMSDRRLDGGGVVSLSLNQTYERRIASAIETIPDGFVIFDRDDNLVVCNQRYRDLLPGAPDLIRPGVNFQDILRAAADSGEYPEAIGQESDWVERRLRLHQSPPSVPHEQRMSGDRWVRIVEAATPDGGRAGLRADVTDTKRLEQELRGARAAAESASLAKSQFLTNMNHEFRTPLNGIIGIASILTEQAADDGSRKLIRTVENSAQALLRIIEDVLETVTYDSRYAVAEQAPFDLTFTIERVVTLLSPNLHIARTDFDMRIADHLPIRFIGDDPRLRQVLAALLGNAFKFGAGGRVSLIVDGTRSNAPTETPTWDLTFAIQDSGPGIPDGASDRIFEPLTQADGTPARAHDGMGLGLSLCRSVVDLLGGQVRHDPAYTNGARFVVTIPVRQDVDAIRAIELPARPLLVRADDVRGRMLERRLTALGLDPVVRDVTGGIDAPATFDVVILQTDALPQGDDAWRRWLKASEGARVVFYGATPSNESLPSRNVVHVDASADTWPALIDALRIAQCAEDVEPPTTLRVLAAEDNRTNQLVLRKLLEPFALDLTVVSSGKDAVEHARRIRPDLIFMDISMPGMDGKQATRQIREWQDRSGLFPIRIVALTAHAMDQDRRDILGAGLDDVLVKPLSRDALAATIASVQADIRRKAGASGADSDGS